MEKSCISNIYGNEQAWKNHLWRLFIALIKQNTTFLRLALSKLFSVKEVSDSEN
jgi:hypothetical protein